MRPLCAWFLAPTAARELWLMVPECQGRQTATGRTGRARRFSLWIHPRQLTAL